jgi:hypothetical protein
LEQLAQLALHKLLAEVVGIQDQPEVLVVQQEPRGQRALLGRQEPQGRLVQQAKPVAILLELLAHDLFHPRPLLHARTLVPAIVHVRRIPVRVTSHHHHLHQAKVLHLQAEQAQAILALAAARHQRHHQDASSYIEQVIVLLFIALAHQGDRVALLVVPIAAVHRAPQGAVVDQAVHPIHLVDQEDPVPLVAAGALSLL